MSGSTDPLREKQHQRLVDAGYAPDEAEHLLNDFERQMAQALGTRRDSATQRVPEQPIEPRPPSDADLLRQYGPNRWAAFSDTQLRRLDDAFGAMADSDAYHVGDIYDDEARSLHAEIQAEQARRPS